MRVRLERKNALEKKLASVSMEDRKAERVHPHEIPAFASHPDCEAKSLFFNSKSRSIVDNICSFRHNQTDRSYMQLSFNFFYKE